MFSPSSGDYSEYEDPLSATGEYDGWKYIEYNLFDEAFSRIKSILEN
jgi:hypothetical protein